MGRLLTAEILGLALAACSFDPPPTAGRPCSASIPCGPDAICDPARGLCVAASLDRGARELAQPREARAGDELAGDGLPGDLLAADRARPTDGGCAGGLTLCGPVCVDLTKDAAHCGACNKPCGAPASDRCVNKLCVCGTTGAACPTGQTCVSGACDANPCLGKGNGTPCDDKLYCTVSDTCKGEVCAGAARDCTSGGPISPCVTVTCDEAIDQCVTTNKLEGTPCGTNGQCYAGSCCTGCWTGTSCPGGKEHAACGEKGDLCQDCTSYECRSLPGDCGGLLYDKCGSLWAKSDGTSCAAGNGQCRNGGCCKGCWDGDGCKPGTQPSSCGVKGSLCANCTSECRTGSTCSGGACSDPAKPDGTSCASGTGKCYSGACCTGCLTQGLCVSGTSPSNCGVGAASCTICPPTAGECKKAVCQAGKCGIDDASDGASCSGGKCLSGSCCKGCISGSSCLPGTSSSACGKGGVNCASCPAATPTCSSTGSCV